MSDFWDKFLHTLHLVDEGGYYNALGFCIGTLFTLVIFIPLPLYGLIIDFQFNTHPLFISIAFIFWTYVLFRGE